MIRTSLLGCILLSTACGGQALSDDGGAGAAGAANSAGSGAQGSGGAVGTGGSAASGGSAGIPGSGGAAGTAGTAGTPGSGGVPASCEKVDDIPIGEPTCADLGPLTVTDMTATDNGDEVFTPGEQIQVSVNLNETSGHWFSYYPGVIFSANHPAVFFGKQEKGEEWLYAIEGCSSIPIATNVYVFGEIDPGTVVEITARVGMLSDDTCTQTHSAKLSFVVN